MFKVDSPAFLKIKHSDQTMDVFLHQGQTGELVYFTKQKIQGATKTDAQQFTLTLNFFDNEKAISVDDDKLVQLSSNLYEPPLLKKIKFEKGSLLLNLLQYILVFREQRVECKNMIELFPLGDQNLLAVTVPFALDRNTGCWIKTHYNNIIFIDLSTQEAIFIVYDADLLIAVTCKDQGSKLKEVLFLRGKQIVKMEWGSPVSMGKYGFAKGTPMQPYLKNYSMLPQTTDTGSKNYTLQINELHRQIEQCRQKNSLIQGRLHWNKERVSLIYSTGGIYTFSLKEKQSYSEPSEFQGQIGEIKDFKLTKFKIVQQRGVVAEGNDERGNFTIQGDVQTQKLPWAGSYEFQDCLYSQSIAEFTITPNDGVIIGKGEDNEGTFQVRGKVTSQTKVKTDSSGNEIEIKKDYCSFQKSYGHKVDHYEGEVSADRIKIWGKWSTGKGNPFQGRFDISMQNKIDLDLTIHYEKGTNWINLKGELDLENATLSGHSFTTSKDLSETFMTDFNHPEKNIFKLVSNQSQDRAEQLYGNTEIIDAQFCQVTALTNSKKLKEVFAMGNLHIKSKRSSTLKVKGYSSIDLDLLNLDDDKFTTRQIMSCVVPKNFKEIPDDRGFKKLPYYALMPFRLCCISDDEISFKTQMFYQDPLQNNRKILFLQGKKSSSTREKDKIEINPPLPQWPPVMTENYTVQYPILAYKSNLATDNELVICNLMMNQPQRFVNIDPYRFVQFVDAGLVPERNFDPVSGKQAINTSIFMLVELNNIYYLMNYRLFPFPLDQRHVNEIDRTKFQFQHQLRLISGSINIQSFKDEIGSNHFTPEKIINAVMLQRSQTDGVQVVIVLQLINQIVYFNLNNQNMKGVVTKQHSKMLKLKMQAGPQDQLYFGELNEYKIHTVVQLTFQDRDELTRKTIYQSDNEHILAMQLEQRVSGIDGKDDSHLLFLLESNKRFKRIHISGSKEETKYQVDLTIDLNFHPGFEKMFHLLRQNKWSSMMMNEVGIIALEAGQSKESLIATTLSTRSDLTHKHEFFGFNDDRKHSMLKQNRKQMSKSSSSVLSVGEISWIDKHMFEVKEATRNYFLITQHTCSKRIDLVRIDIEQVFLEEVILLGNSLIGIKLKMTNAYMCFSQKDFTFVQHLEFLKIQPLTSVSDGEQYFICDKQGDNNPSTVIKISAKGSRTTLYTEVEDYLQKVAVDFFQFSEESSVQCSFSSDYRAFDPEPDQLILGFFIYCYLPGYHHASDGQETEFIGSYIDVFIYAFDQSTDTAAHPTIFALQCDLWSPTQYKQALFTKEYLVIKHDDYICFIKRIEMDMVAYSNCGTIDSDHPERSQKNFQKLIEKQGGKKVAMHLINTKKLTAQIRDNDFNILNVAQYDIDVAEKGEQRTNVIQISFGNVSIMWDLDEHKEVTFISKPDELLNNSENYVVTGFVPYLKKDSHNPHMSNVAYFTQNENRSLILSPKTDIFQSNIFRTYTAINMMDVYEIMRKEKNNLYVAEIDENTVLQNFNGLTFFQIFNETPEYLELIEEQIKKKSLQDQVEVDNSGEVSDNMFIRQIYWTLNIPVVGDHTGVPVLRPNILQFTMFSVGNQHMLDSFLRLLMMSREHRLGNLIANFNCFEQVFDIQSTENDHFLSEAFIQNSQSLEVKSLLWNPLQKLITFGTNYSLMSPGKIIEEVQGEQLKRLGSWDKFRLWLQPEKEHYKETLKTFHVKVKILEIEWLSDSLHEFYEYLALVDDDIVFGNDFIKVLLEQQNYSGQIFTNMFVPYIIYMACCLTYFTAYLPHINKQSGGFFGTDDDRFLGFIRIVILIGAIFFLGVEIKQLFNQKLKYLTDKWNYFSWSANIIAIIIVIDSGIEKVYELNTLIQLSSIAIVLQWLMLFYWLRLFPNLAFYVTMIVETIKDISTFLIMFVAVIVMFANSIYALNQIEVIINGDEDNPQTDSTYQKAFSEPFLDSVVHQYRVGLGDLITIGYADHPAKVLVWIYFVLATLFTQIMFLNMLIAIMGQTFARVNEAKDRNQLMERTQIYADFLWMIKLTEELKGQRYLYVVRPVNQSVEETNQVDEAREKIVSAMESGFEKTNEDIDVLKKKVTQLVSQHNTMNNEIKQGFEELKGILTEIKNSRNK